MRNRAYIAGYAVILVVAAFALHHMWRQHLETRLLIAEDGIEDAAAQFESLIENSAGHVTMLRISAESLLDDLASGHFSAAGLGRHLHVSAHDHGYCSGKGRDGHDDDGLMSSVSGAGPVPAPGSALGQEVEMSLLLAPQFAAAAENIPNMAWAYYTSANRFIAMYPNVSCADFFYSDDLRAHEFFSLGRPEVNPHRSQFWTSAYVDEAGKGLMATLGAPVYGPEGNFRGTVAIDLTMETLSRYVASEELGEGTLLVVNAQEQVLAHPSLLIGDVAAAPRLGNVLGQYDAGLRYLVFGEHKGFVARKGQLFASRALKGSPWRLIYVTDQAALRWQAWKDSVVEVAGLLLLILVIVAFETARRRSAQLKVRIAELDEANKQAMKARREADDANRAKSIMLANVSHDLRTPLNAIIGFSDLMQHQLFGSMNERYVAYARDIQMSGELLLKIINNLLDLSKVESGQFKLQEEVVDIGDLVEKSRHLMADQALAVGITLKARIAHNLPAVKADPRALQRVVLNLLSNAIKFTRHGGSVSVDVWCDPNRRVTISVADTGIGISRKDQEHLFQPFSRGESAWKANHEGTGLGLSIVKSLVELHGGQVTMESAVSVGTTVTVTLPPSRNQRLEAVATLDGSKPETEAA
ncbi:sensor histidine kinase [Dongia deserti]|uniref:sensor histidine kinase n=1 Tax=Dongia deserti TaxID=2268030 RepID=UPI000E650BDF|nr:sensor histidine kinase [Dongia deserti]